LYAATDTCAWPCSAAVTVSAVACTAAIAPPSGSAPIRRARSQISRAPSSSDITPATVAAATSPTEWPITTAGVTPQWRHSPASDTASANSAGWVYSVRSSNVPSGSNSSSSSGRPM